MTFFYEVKGHGTATEALDFITSTLNTEKKALRVVSELTNTDPI